MQVNRGVRYSTMLHGGLLLIALIGLPHFQKKLINDQSVIAIEVVPEDKTSNAQQTVKPTIQQPPAPVPPRDIPVVRQTTNNPPSPPQIPKVIDRPVPPAVKSVTPVKPVDNTSLKDILDKVREDARINADKNPATDATPQKQPTIPVTTNVPASIDPTSLPISMTEIDKIKRQIEEKWSAPTGAKDAQNLIVKLLVKVSSDGTVISVTHTGDQSRYLSESNFNAAVQSAIRAVYLASPLQNLPADRYSSWSEMELVFNPADMVN